MKAIEGVYEVAIRVSDLARSEAFYTEVLGLTVGLRDERRPWLFLRAGGTRGMIVLQQEAGDWPKQHLAFSVPASEIESAAEELRQAGVQVEGPVVHDWIPARSAYFADPDGHELELCAPLEPGAVATPPA